MSSGIERTHLINEGFPVNGQLNPSDVELLAEEVFSERDADRAEWTFCGDERAPEVASADTLTRQHPGVAPVQEGGIGLYGQAFGIAQATAVSIMAQAGPKEGPEIYERLGGLSGIQDLLVERTDRKTGLFAVKLGLHTADDKEIIAFSEVHDSEEDIPHGISEETLAARGLLAVVDGQPKMLFCPRGTGATGCAYTGNAGAVSHALGHDEGVQAKVASDIAHLNGGRPSQWAETIFDANRQLEELLPGNAGYSFGRQEYMGSGLPVMSLEGGPHAQADQTALLFGFDPRFKSVPGKFYRGDVAAAALAVEQALPEAGLNPRLLMETMIAASVPTRAVLASHDISGDHTPDPKRIVIGGYGGTIDSAVAAVEEYRGASRA